MKSLLTPDYKKYSAIGLGLAKYIQVIIGPVIDNMIEDGYSRAEIGHIILTEISSILGGKNA